MERKLTPTECEPVEAGPTDDADASIYTGCEPFEADYRDDPEPVEVGEEAFEFGNY